MWSSRRIFAIFAICAGLGGCGFSPMYGSSENRPGPSSELAKIDVAPIPDREGQLLHNALLTRLTPLGQPESPVYRLSVDYKLTSDKGVLQKDSTATRNTITYRASYRLSQDDQVVARGVVSRAISYDYLAEHYANVAAERDARQRAALVIADAISSELASYFLRRERALAQGQAGSGR